jgi:hypothetical protein
MGDTIEDNVGIDPNAELFVVKMGDIVTTYGFDYVQDRCERMALNLVLEGFVLPPRGTRASFDMMNTLQGALKLMCDLSMQLVGLESHRVEVIDHPGDPSRTFIVGRSSGWFPVHLEIKTTRSMGGDPARLEYHSVRDLGPSNR